MVVMRHRPKVVMTKPMATSLRAIEFGRERSGDGEEEHEHESAGGDGHAGLAGGVAHDLLQELRDEDGGGVEGDADHEHDELGHADVAAREEAQVEDGMFDGELAPEEERESDDRDDGQRDDEAGAEPVVFLALVEHDLEGADGDDEKAESPVVDAFAALADFGEVGRVFDQAVGEIERDDADGDVEEEDPAPGVVVDDPAADGGAEDGGGDDGDSVDGEGHAALLRAGRCRRGWTVRWAEGRRRLRPGGRGRRRACRGWGPGRRAARRR